VLIRIELFSALIHRKKNRANLIYGYASSFKPLISFSLGPKRSLFIHKEKELSTLILVKQKGRACILIKIMDNLNICFMSHTFEEYDIIFWYL
jgi:hypothetical protein